MTEWDVIAAYLPQIERILKKENDGADPSDKMLIAQMACLNAVRTYRPSRSDFWPYAQGLIEDALAAAKR